MRGLRLCALIQWLYRAVPATQKRDHVYTHTSLQWTFVVGWWWWCWWWENLLGERGWKGPKRDCATVSRFNLTKHQLWTFEILISKLSKLHEKKFGIKIIPFLPKQCLTLWYRYFWRLCWKNNIGKWLYWVFLPHIYALSNNLIITRFENNTLLWSTPKVNVAKCIEGIALFLLWVLNFET